MTKIINGKKYSTVTATFVGEASYSHHGDFNWWYEALYIKRTGEFFLFGQGGALSNYCTQVGQNEWSGGKEIVPLSLSEAQEWAEEYLDYDTFVEYFGEVDE